MAGLRVGPIIIVVAAGGRNQLDLEEEMPRQWHFEEGATNLRDKGKTQGDPRIGTSGINGLPTTMDPR